MNLSIIAFRNKSQTKSRSRRRTLWKNKNIASSKAESTGLNQEIKQKSTHDRFHNWYCLFLIHLNILNVLKILTRTRCSYWLDVVIQVFRFQWRLLRLQLELCQYQGFFPILCFFLFLRFLTPKMLACKENFGYEKTWKTVVATAAVIWQLSTRWCGPTGCVSRIYWLCLKDQPVVSQGSTGYVSRIHRLCPQDPLVVFPVVSPNWHLRGNTWLGWTLGRVDSWVKSWPVESVPNEAANADLGPNAWTGPLCYLKLAISH